MPSKQTALLAIISVYLHLHFPNHDRPTEPLMAVAVVILWVPATLLAATCSVLRCCCRPADVWRTRRLVKQWLGGNAGCSAVKNRPAVPLGYYSAQHSSNSDARSNRQIVTGKMNRQPFFLYFFSLFFFFIFFFRCKLYLPRGHVLVACAKAAVRDSQNLPGSLWMGKRSYEADLHPKQQVLIPPFFGSWSHSSPKMALERCSL